ncbi:unnamed protein product [marine sediment metagenome]|uniref:Uncharacterized protein n=1 Tax=marine sediment metagenome TaxID=412755 RepID=X1C390_9ZZZZ
MAISFRGPIRKLMPRAIKMGMLPTHYLKLCKEKYGKAYRRTDFLGDWREFAGIERKRDPLRAIPKKLRPTAATTQKTEYTQSKKFHYNYKIEGYDTILKKDTVEDITVASDDLISMEEAEAEAQRLADKYKVDIDIAKIIIDGVTVK